MKTALLAIAASSLLTIQATNAADPKVKSYAIPSWGDYTLVYGPDTDPAMDTPAAMERMFRFWKARGYNGVFLRSDLQQFDPYVRRNPKKQMNAALALRWQFIDEQSEGFDYFEESRKAAEKIGFEFWVWHPHLFSQGAPENVGVPAWGRMVPWSYVSKLLYEHPEVVTVDRKGNKYWMIPEYAYPISRSAHVEEFVYMAKKYKAKNFIVSMRSEVNQLIDPADKADRYGFNQPVVDDMKRLYNVDIMTDPRFDVDSPNFDTNDAMVNKWRDLRGSYVTQFFRDLRKALSAIDPKIKIATSLAGEHAGPPLGNWRTDWRTWVDEGLVDMIITPVFFEATLDPDVPKKGYLTNALTGVGTVPMNEMRAYIEKSKFPGIQILSTTGPPYFLRQPPEGADGWQRDVWYSSYHLAWYQRWQQYLRDVKEFGAIKFIAQDFDEVSPARFAGESGGWGHLTYNPKIRACPAGWWRLGTGTNSRPFAQSTVRRGNKGQAIQLTRAADGSDTLTGWHTSSPDRSKFTNEVDTSVVNGQCTFNFWLMRKSAESGVAAYLQNDGSELDIGLRIAPETGLISYSTGRAGDSGQWVATDKTIPVGQWQKFTIQVDLDRQHYAAQTGDMQKVSLCTAVPYTVPKERFVEHNNVKGKIPVPVYREIQRVYFVPEGATGNTTFLDDVEVLWKPTLHYFDHGKNIVYAEDFEERRVDEGLIGSKWKAQNVSLPPHKGRVPAPQPDHFVINDMSFGNGVKSLIVNRGTVVPLRDHKLNTKEPLTVDFDVFIGSDDAYPYLIPNPTTTSAHRMNVSLAKSDGTPVAGVAAGDGTWRLWDGSNWRDSGIKVNYDAWNHLQFALDGNGASQVVVQPEGQVPVLAGKGSSSPISNTDKLSLSINASGDHFACYDNLFVTSGRPTGARN